jgi:hypothetical protein
MYIRPYLGDTAVGSNGIGILASNNGAGAVDCDSRRAFGSVRTRILYEG